MKQTAHDIIHYNLSATEASLLRTVRDEDDGYGFESTSRELMAASGIATPRALRSAVKNLVSNGLLTTSKQGRSTVWGAFSHP